MPDKYRYSNEHVHFLQRYGGYDIILIQVAHPMDNVAPICLPTVNFKDDNIHATIAGYGKYKRAPCEVDSHGPSKFRYCGVEPDCQYNTPKHENANCSIQFEYKVSCDSVKHTPNMQK